MRLKAKSTMRKVVHMAQWTDSIVNKHIEDVLSNGGEIIIYNIQLLQLLYTIHYKQYNEVLSTKSQHNDIIIHNKYYYDHHTRYTMFRQIFSAYRRMQKITEIRLYLTLSDWFGTKPNSVCLQINRKIDAEC